MSFFEFLDLIKYGFSNSSFRSVSSVSQFALLHALLDLFVPMYFSNAALLAMSSSESGNVQVICNSSLVVCYLSSLLSLCSVVDVRCHDYSPNVLKGTAIEWFH